MTKLQEADIKMAVLEALSIFNNSQLSLYDIVQVTTDKITAIVEEK